MNMDTMNKLNWALPMPVAEGRISAGAWPLLLLLGITAIGLLLRLNGLGAVGVYHDEKYMVLAVRGILDTGLPYLPSGMFYPRALTQLYLMSGSVMFFGESEWAFRLPSAIAGTLCIPLAYYLGRQFSQPLLALAFAASVALLPSFIEVSQIARMYVFLVLSVLLFLIMLRHWERSTSWLAAGGMLLVLVIAIEFQALAVFALPLIAVPVITSPSRKRLLQAAVVGLAGAVSFHLIRGFGREQYANTLDQESAVGARHPAMPDEAGVLALPPELLALLLGLLLAAALVVAWSLFRRFREDGLFPGQDTLVLGGGGLMLMAALMSAGLMSYLVAAMLLCVGAAFHLRGGGRAWVVWLAMVVMALTLVGQAAVLFAGGGLTGPGEVLRNFFGVPSPVPFIRFFQLFPLAVALFVLLLGLDLYRFSRGSALPAYPLLFAFGVVLPMLAMGVFIWGVAPRYMFGLVPVFLLCLFLALQHQAHRVGPWLQRHPQGARVLALAVVVALVPVGAFGNALDRTYGPYPDHKGAAQFMLDLPRNTNDIVMAMEVPIQTYYLGTDKIDYFLGHYRTSGWQSRRVDGEVLSIFTGTPVLYNAEAFSAVLERQGRGDVYVIGSGEITGAVDIAYALGDRIPLLFEAHDAEVVFLGADGKTRIWRFAASPAAGERGVVEFSESGSKE